MRTSVVILGLLLAPACETAPPRSAGGQSSQASTSQSGAESRSPSQGALDRPGVFAPHAATALALWPQAWRGELVLVEVLAHGTAVKEGDVIARVEPRGIDEDLHQAELDAASAAINQRGVVERNKIEDDAARSARERAQAEADRAVRALEGWKTRELDFARRGDEISREYTKNGIDDQVDELDQLEKMYKADELVDATEEIVLKRSRRQLALSRTGQALQSEQIQYKVDYDRARDTQVREEAAKSAREALARLIATQDIERAARADAERRSQDSVARQQEKLERLRRDRELMTLRAPRAGVLLHGSAQDYHPGRAQRVFARGQSLTPRTDVFLVADPVPATVALEIPESSLAALASGAQVKVRLVAGSGEGAGALSVDPYPLAANAAADDGVHEASVLLSQPIPGALYGMRARVVLPDKKRDSE